MDLQRLSSGHRPECQQLRAILWEPLVGRTDAVGLSQRSILRTICFCRTLDLLRQGRPANPQSAGSVQGERRTTIRPDSSRAGFPRAESQARGL